MKKIYGILILGLALTPSFLFAYTSGSIFEVTNSTNAKKFTILDSGNVGIGTTTPGTTLNYGGTTNYTVLGMLGPSSNRGSVLELGGRGMVAGSGNPAGIVSFVSNGVSGVGYQLAAIESFPETAQTNGALSFKTLSSGTTASERMRITSAGNVGIGTTSPTQKLTVQGNILADSYLEYSPIYIGDAISVIRNIRALPITKAGNWQEVDHDSLPEGVKYTENIIVPAIYDENNRIVTAASSYLFTGRNMSKQVQLNLRAIQQLITENDNLKARITALENRVIIR